MSFLPTKTKFNQVSTACFVESFDMQMDHPTTQTSHRIHWDWYISLQSQLKFHGKCR